MILQNLKQCREASPKRRDAFRRMLTHLAQESSSLPATFLVEAQMTRQDVDGGGYGTIDVGDSYGRTVAMKAVKVYPRTGNTLNRLRVCHS